MSRELIIKKTHSIPTILVSKGISFLGLNLCAKLLEKGARVVVLDTVTDEVRIRAKNLLIHPNFALFNFDPDKGLPEKIQSVDYILALNYPDDLLADNFNLVSEAFFTKNLLDLAVGSKAKFALVEPCFHRKVESTDNVETYSHSKNSSFLRSLIWDYVKKKKLDGRIIRVCQVYGGGMPLELGYGLARFIDSILNGKDLKILGDGIAKGSYLQIDDAVSGIIKALFYKRTSGRIFKLLSKNSHADLELAFILRGLANTELNLEYSDIPQQGFIFDTLLGETIPRWEQTKTLKQGLTETLEGFGYEVNNHSFKPNKVIEAKLSESQKVREITSLVGLKEETVGKPSFADFPKQKATFKLPKLKIAFPKLPRLNTFPRLPRFPKLSSRESNPQKRVSARPQLINAKIVKALYPVSFVTLILLFTLIVPVTQTYFHCRSAYKSMEDVSLNMSQLQTESSKIAAKDAFENFHRASIAFKKLNWIFSLVGQKDMYSSANSLLGSATNFTGTLYRTSKALDPFSSSWEVVKPNSEANLETRDFEISLIELSQARNTLDLAIADFKLVNKANVPSILSAKVEKYEKALNFVDSLLNDALIVIRTLPGIVGAEEEKHYLLLLQNSNELRPTGGFIGSYAVLILEKGKIKSLNLDDIYNPDGQIDTRGIVSDIPAPLAEFLDEDVMHIRNANWSPDFPSSAASIEDLFFKLDGTTFDGVIALDLDLVKSVLDVTGPVFLAAFNEEVSSENVYERAQYHSGFDYQDGISDKKSFLTVLSGKLLESVFALPNEKLPAFVNVIATALNQKHLLITMDNPSVASFLEGKGWTGSMENPGGDFLMIVNSNLGGTKSNYFVENSYDYSVTSDTRDGLLRSHLILDYKHNGTDNAWPAGPYTDYLRIYVPLGARLTGTTKSLENALPEDIFEQVISYDEGNYTVFATSFVLEPQENLRLSLTYDLPDKLLFSKEVKDYSLYWQKQPGTQDDVFRFYFRGPFGTEITTYSPSGMFKEKNMASFEGFLNTDTEMNLILK